MLTLAFEKLHCERIRVASDQQFFIGEKTQQRFTPIGFNYDHDEYYRLLEDYWHDEWEKVEKDFVMMRALGANVIRIHLQFNTFILSLESANEQELQQLDRLIDLARSLGLTLNIVGLGCYHDWEVPDWYTTMECHARWEVQAFFWETLARRYAGEPAIFCFDLMNEPVVPGRQRQPGTWLGSEFAGKSYIQFISLDGTQESREKTAIDWLQRVSRPVREHDPARLVTVGLVDWSLPKSSIKSGFFPQKIAPYVDFISVHLYPESGRVEPMLKTLSGFCVGKPVVIDETFHLKCSVEEQIEFLQKAAQRAQGFSPFYTDFMPESVDNGRNQAMRDTLHIFSLLRPVFVRR